MLSGAYPATPYNGELLACRLVKQQIYIQSHPVCGEGGKEGRNESTNHWDIVPFNENISLMQLQMKLKTPDISIVSIIPSK